MSEFQLTSYGDDEGPMISKTADRLDEATFKQRFVKHMIDATGNAEGVEEYATMIVGTYWYDYERGYWTDETPEELADADMSEWEPE